MLDMDSGCIYTLNLNLSEILDIMAVTMSSIFMFGVERMQEQISANGKLVETIRVQNTFQWCEPVTINRN